MGKVGYRLDCEEEDEETLQVGTGTAEFTEARDLQADVDVWLKAALKLRSYGATAIKVNEYYVEFPPLTPDELEATEPEPEPAPKPRKRTRKAR
jgi:hypothetical protein